MSEDDNSEIMNTAKGLNIGAVVPEVYKDAISPAAKEIGKGLETIAKTVNIALKPLSITVWGFDKIEKYIMEELPKVLKEKGTESIISPDPHVAGPTIESLKYTANKEELRKMYLNLLAMSMDKDSSSRAHPSFVEVIRQLSLDEAKLLSFIKKEGIYPAMRDRSASFFRTEQSSYKRLLEYFYEICEAAGIDNPGLYRSYLDNLTRLKILEIETYSSRLNFHSLRKQYSDKEQIKEVRLKRLIVTSYGKYFIKTCT
ncbi:hypothetical protein KUL42_39550 [Alteromonas sp. KUL42]|uniref:DUF4393 domain-containing protein n=1 Tax=Alteromonas sp. KUL42 TaxID=2480797 RepID=UPI001035CDC9|nr:DUF4393 domain-containing protein [Alteromonas sp. KUL42]TAP31757.1 DUF4393 domain-containing protein [Alteromonas sp. KUL42]GEA09194.1 hypothetical protein KUL42_39550 [Alteromonas sp. KUL42]